MRAGEGAGEKVGVADAVGSAMFGDLFGMHGGGNVRRPQPVGGPGHGLERLLGKFAERALAAGHDIARGRHLRVEVGLRRGQLDPARRAGDGQRSADLRPRMRQQVLGKDKHGGIANLLDGQHRAHAGMMIGGVCGSKRGRCRRARYPDASSSSSPSGRPGSPARTLAKIRPSRPGRTRPAAIRCSGVG